MINTYTSYQLITRDIDAATKRVETQPMVKRETEYFLANIGKVTSIEEFLDDTRLFNYAMKAHGLEDMAYAKAFMKKALTEGLDDPDSFANKLTDKRYAEFVASFNFAAYGENATTYNPAATTTVSLYVENVVENGGLSENAAQSEIAYFQENIVNVGSIDEFLADDRLLGFALQAFGLEEHDGDKAFIRKFLEGGLEAAETYAEEQDNDAYAAFAAAFDFAGRGEETTSRVAARDDVIDKYMRQTLEEDAGTQNEGVRLALYFQRKASEITSIYEILADTALSQLVRTTLGFPDSFATSDVDKQAAAIAKRLDVADLQDPVKLEKFLARFTAMWEMENPSSPTLSVASILIDQPVAYGLSTDTLLALATLKR